MKIVTASAIAVLIGTIGLAPQAMALCQNMDETYGCKVNNNGPTFCRGTAQDDKIVAPEDGCVRDENSQQRIGCVISGFGKDDTIIGSNKDDTICGGPGNNRLAGNNGDDTLVGGKGNDVTIGAFGHDIAIGGAGTDVLVGGPDEDDNNGGANPNNKEDICVEANTNRNCEIVL